MKLVVTLFLMLAAGPTGLAQDVDEIIAKGLDAVGGVERLKAVQSRSFSGDASFNGGTVESRMGGQVVSQFTIKKVEFDVKLDDSLFTKPTSD